MKKIVAGVLVVFVFLLVGCGAVSSASSHTSSRVPDAIPEHIDLLERKISAEMLTSYTNQSGILPEPTVFVDCLRDDEYSISIYIDFLDIERFSHIGPADSLTKIFFDRMKFLLDSKYNKTLDDGVSYFLRDCTIVVYDGGVFAGTFHYDDKTQEYVFDGLVESSTVSSSADSVSFPLVADSSIASIPSASPASPPTTKTASQEQAIRKAKEYLAYTSFSASGLIGQLEYEGFSNEDAAFAVNSIDVDWNEQAAKKAQEYLDYSSFSRQSLISQLLYEGFSDEQAAYGVDAVGL